MGGFDLDPFLLGERAQVEKALGRALEGILPLLPDDLCGPATHAVRAEGKRLRPILCVTAFAACGGGEPSDGIYDLAVSVELIHAYSLMHDDLPCMDDADLRRGSPTPHTIYGEAPTMAAGAALIPSAAWWAWDASGRLGLPPEVRRALIRILARAAGVEGMVGGQALDLLAEGRALSREALDTLHRMKTGALLTASLALGATAAEAPPDVGEAVRRYGEGIGLAFQIADDVLDATADAETLGKIPSDMDRAKATYVSLHGVEAARVEAESLVEAATGALRDAGVASPALDALGRYVIGRDR